MSVLDRADLGGVAPEVARVLLGARLVREDETGLREGRIVEVEAYAGPEDRASHARFGSSRRNRVMFGPPGVAYVYLVYGMYDCLNVVTGPEGDASAVLIRAVEPLAGLEMMRAGRLAVAARRRAAREGSGLERARVGLARVPDHHLATGPGNLAAAFGIDTTWTGTDLCAPASPLRLERDVANPADSIDEAAVLVGHRIGVDYAGPEWAARPWRWSIAGHPSVSGPPTR